MPVPSNASTVPSSPRRNPSRIQTPTTLLKRGFKPSIQSLNLLLSSLFRARKTHLLLEIFTQISSNSIAIDSWTHSLAARALLKARRFKEAEHFISDAQKQNLYPRKSLWDSLIREVCVAGGNAQAALSILQECVRSRGVFPSVKTYHLVKIFFFSSRGEIGRAIEMMEAMVNGEKTGYSIDNFVTSSIISGFCKIGKPELGLLFFDRVKKTHCFQPNLVTYTAVVDALCRGGRLEDACELVMRLEKEGIALNAAIYSSLICGYLRKGDLSEGLRQHGIMVEKAVVPDVISYTNLIDGMCKEGVTEKVIGFLYEMEKNGLRPNVVTYAVVIQGLCNRGKLEEAFCVLKRMEELGIAADEIVYSVLINGLCKKGDLEGALSLLGSMADRGVEVGTVTYNTVVSGLCKAGKTSKADEISRGFSCDNFTYSALLHGYTKEINVAGLMETKRRLEAAGISIDIVTCNLLIKALFMAGRVEDASNLFKEMPHKGIMPNSVTYCTMIIGFGKLGKIAKALEIFEEYKRTAMISDASCHNCIIRVLCKEHMTEMAIEVFQDLTKREIITNSEIYKVLIAAQFREGNGEDVLKFIHRLDKVKSEFLSDLCDYAVTFLCTNDCLLAALDILILLRRRGTTITRKSYYLLLKSLMRSGDKKIAHLLICDYVKLFGTFDQRIINIIGLYLCQKNVKEAVQFLSERGKENISIGVLTIVVEALMKDGRLIEAHDFIMDVGENRVLKDVVVYSVVVDGLCKEGYVEKALDLCANMIKEGIHPNILIYNSVINGLCQQGCLVEAFRLFDSLERKSLLPTIVTYATLIGALCREGFLEDANRLFEKMSLRGIAPSTGIYNLLINGSCRFGLVEEALKLLLYLEGNSLQPDGFTISAMINGYCLNGDIEGALCFFGEYRKKGFPPDFLGFMNLIKGLIAKGRMEEARTVLRDMLQCADVMSLINKTGDELHVDSLGGLLALACDQGRIKEVIDVLSEVGFTSSSSWRSYNGSKHRRLEELQEKGHLGADVGSICSISSGASLTMEVPRNMYRGLAWQCMNAHAIDIDHTLCKRGEDGSEMENHVCLMGKSLYYDFETFYTIVKSLCAKGELQNANNIVKEMLSIS